MGSIVACPKVAGRSSAAPTGSADEDDDDDEEDFVRIPIEIRPRGRLGLKSAHSWGRGGGGGGHSDLSFDFEPPEWERTRREWSLSLQASEQKAEKLRARLEALELRHRRVCTELKALQRTCAALRRERHQALVAEQQALARARLFMAERDRARHQLAAEAATPRPLTSSSPLEAAPERPLGAARCLLDVDVTSGPALPLLEHFVGAKWRLDGATASDGVLRLAVLAATLTTEERAALAAAAAPLRLHLLLLPPSGAPPLPAAFEVAAFDRCLAICRQRSAVEVARTPPTPLSRLWRPAGVWRLLAEQRHLLRSELDDDGAPASAPPALLAHLEATTARPALRIDASDRPAFLRWLSERFQRPGCFFFASALDEGSSNCPLALLRQFLADQLSVGPSVLLPPAPDAAVLRRDIAELLSAAPLPPKEPLVVALAGDSAEACSELLSRPLPAVVKFFWLPAKPQEGEEAAWVDAELNDDCLELLTAISEGEDLLERPCDSPEAVCRLLQLRLVRPSAMGLQFASPRAASFVQCRLIAANGCASHRQLLQCLVGGPGGLQSSVGSASALVCCLASCSELSPRVSASPEDLAGLGCLCGAAIDGGEADRAVTLLLRCWERLEAELEPEDGRLAWCLSQLARAMAAAGRNGDARRLWRQLAAGQGADSELGWCVEARADCLEQGEVAWDELALLWAVTKAWDRLLRLSERLECELVAPQEALVAWQAVAVAQAALGEEDGRLQALRQAMEAAQAAGDDDTASAVQRHFQHCT